MSAYIRCEVMVYARADAHGPVAEMLSAPFEGSRGQHLNRMDPQLAGGDESPLGGVWWGCFADAHPQTLFTWFHSLPWVEPTSALLLYKTDLDEWARGMAAHRSDPSKR